MTETYARRWQGVEPPGVGRGATFEAKIIHQRLYEETGGKNTFCRPVIFDRGDRLHIPTELRGYRCYHAEADFADLVAWLKAAPLGDDGSDSVSEPAPWPPRPADFHWRMANRTGERGLFADMLGGETGRTILFLEGRSGRGKSLLVHELIRYVEILPDCELCHIDCKASPTDDQFRGEICHAFGLQPENLCEQLEHSPSVRVLIIDTYEVANEELQRWIEQRLLPAICRAQHVVCVIGGQRTPARDGTRLQDDAFFRELRPIDDPKDWEAFHDAQDTPNKLPKAFVRKLIAQAGGDPRLIRAILEGPGS